LRAAAGVFRVEGVDEGSVVFGIEWDIQGEHQHPDQNRRPRKLASIRRLAAPAARRAPRVVRFSQSDIQESQRSRTLTSRRAPSNTARIAAAERSISGRAPRANEP
jgi:hypothetical protein